MSENKDRSARWLGWFFTYYPGVLISIMLLALIAVGVFARRLEQRLDDIEASVAEKLRYRPPEVTHVEEESSLPAAGPSRRTYVPAHSHVYGGEGEPLLLTVTLAVRNTDPDHAIRIHSARYYDTSGKLLKDFLAKPLRIGPLATVEYLVSESDTAGGSGANFIVEWTAAENVNAPIIEAVMIGASGGQGISFVQQGREIGGPTGVTTIPSPSP